MTVSACTAPIITSTPSAPTNFTNTGTATSVTVVSGGGQSATVSTAFPNPIVVKVWDGAGGTGNGVAGQTVTFTPPITGASAVFPSGPFTTDINGLVTLAASSVTANPTVGSYNVTVARGLAINTNLALTNLVVAPTNLIAVFSGSGQATVDGTSFANARGRSRSLTSMETAIVQRDRDFYAAGFGRIGYLRRRTLHDRRQRRSERYAERQCLRRRPVRCRCDKRLAGHAELWPRRARCSPTPAQARTSWASSQRIKAPVSPPRFSDFALSLLLPTATAHLLGAKP